MYADYSEKLAKLIVKYSVNVQPEDTVYISGSTNAGVLVREVYREVIKAGGHVIRVKLFFNGEREILYNYASEKQLKYVDPLEIEFLKK